MTPADVLEQAATEIEKRGHAKGCALDGLGRVCAHMAVNWVSTPDRSARQAAKDALLPLTDGNITCWNDRHERTAEEVTSTMRAAAALWRARNEESVNISVRDKTNACKMALSDGH